MDCRVKPGNDEVWHECDRKKAPPGGDRAGPRCPKAPLRFPDKSLRRNYAITPTLRYSTT